MKAEAQKLLINWGECSSKGAEYLTEMKFKYIISIGDINIRTLIMATSTTLCFGALNFVGKPFILGKIRNAGLCLIINGLIWTPEFSNPFFIPIYQMNVSEKQK